MGHKNTLTTKNNCECYVATAELLRPKKKIKKHNLSPIILGYLFSRKGSKKRKHMKRMKILLDSGCSETLVNSDVLGKLKTKKTSTSEWKTQSGMFKTDRTCKVTFTLPTLYENREIEWKAYVTESTAENNRYDMIIGRDLMHEVGIDLKFSTGIIEWDNAETSMLSPTAFNSENLEQLEKESLFIHDPVTTEADRIQSILDAKYKPADLKQIASECKLLNLKEQQLLLKLMSKYKDLFDGTLGTWNTEPVDLELKDPNCKPYYAKPYPVPHSQEQQLREEVERLCNDNILRQINRSEWASPSFTIKKPDNSLRSLANYIELNKQIKRKPYPLPKINDMLQKLEGFMWATSLDLNMGYYHIELTPNASRYCTVVFPWGKL